MEGEKGRRTEGQNREGLDHSNVTFDLRMRWGPAEGSVHVAAVGRTDRGGEGGGRGPARGGSRNGLPRLGVVGGREKGSHINFALFHLIFLFKLFVMEACGYSDPHEPMTEPKAPPTRGLSCPFPTCPCHPHPGHVRAHPARPTLCVNLSGCISER